LFFKSFIIKHIPPFGRVGKSKKYPPKTQPKPIEEVAKTTRFAPAMGQRSK
jgi:hypothetical protein